jgi:hypothetical protein
MLNLSNERFDLPVLRSASSTGRYFKLRTGSISSCTLYRDYTTHDQQMQINTG